MSPFNELENLPQRNWHRVADGQVLKNQMTEPAPRLGPDLLPTLLSHAQEKDGFSEAKGGPAPLRRS